MGIQLKRLEVDQNRYLSEKACEHYKCRSCGQKMVSVNFVNGICIQVFTTHGSDCTLFTGNGFERTMEVTCESCSYHDEEKGCTWEGEERLL